MSGDKDTEIHYRLARTVARFFGTVVKDADPRTLARRVSASDEISLDVEADARLDWQCRLPVEDEHFTSNAIDLRFAEDGRLTAGSGKTSGSGGAAIEAGVRIGAMLASFVTSAAASVVARQRAPKSPEERFAAEHPGSGERRAKLKAAAEALQASLAERATQLADAAHLPVRTRPSRASDPRLSRHSRWSRAGPLKRPHSFRMGGSSGQQVRGGSRRCRGGLRRRVLRPHVRLTPSEATRDRGMLVRNAGEAGRVTPGVSEAAASQRRKQRDD